MSIKPVIDDLKSIYRGILDGTDPVRLGDSDVARWSAETSLTRDNLYNAIAHHLAFAFIEGELSFEFCDAVINDLNGIVMRGLTANANAPLPPLFWETYLAFDAGEFYPNNDRSIDPVERFTRPQLTQILQKYGHPD
jgi:hypothetical protein